MHKLFQRLAVSLEKEHTFFYLILFIASALRFYNYYDWSFSHDELSAIVRLNYDSVSRLISEGIRPDGHPAFVQLFLFFWIKLFGFSQMMVRLPFVMTGIGSVALMYLIAKRWFGFVTACFSSLTLAILVFPILYSQLARPYSFGLFFSLLAVLCWTNLLFGSGKNIYRKAILYGVATVFCMLTHYFSFFFSMVVAVTGFLFLKKETWAPYLLSGVIAIIIFIPHISISLHQFSKQGVGEWLAKPEKDYLWKFILYGFNDSPLVVIAIAMLFLLSVLLYHIDILPSKFHFICIGWFLFPFLAGYYYSLSVNPVLQYSTLLFSFPFLPLFLFSFFKERRIKINNLLLISLGLILSYSTLVEQKFYKREYFGVFKEINQTVIDLQKRYGSEKITTVLNTSDKDILNFYFDRWNEPVGYDFYAGDDSAFVPDMLYKINVCTTSYFMYGWSNFRSDYEIPELIKRKFPCIVYDEPHFNSQITLFGKSDSCHRDTIFYVYADFDSLFVARSRAPGTGVLSFDSTKIDTTYSRSGKRSLNIESNKEFCITLKTTVKQLFSDNSGCVNISARIYAKGKFNAQIVMDVGDLDGQKIWQAKLLSSFIKNLSPKPEGNESGWQEVFVTLELPPAVYPDDEVVIYLWNPDRNSFFLDDFMVSSFADSKYDYYQTSYRK